MTNTRLTFRERLAFLASAFLGTTPTTAIASSEPVEAPTVVEPSPPPPADVVRKGTVLRQKQFVRKPPYQPFHGKPGGPCVTFVIALDDELGQEVVTVEAPVRASTSLVGEGDRVTVTYMYSLRCPSIDWIDVSLDLESFKEFL